MLHDTTYLGSPRNGLSRGSSSFCACEHIGDLICAQKSAASQALGCALRIELLRPPQWKTCSLEPAAANRPGECVPAPGPPPGRFQTSLGISPDAGFLCQVFETVS